MSRPRRRASAALFAASFAGGVLAACSAFDLGDVVNDEPFDASTDGGADASSDSASLDGDLDAFGACVPNGNPCACIPEQRIIARPSGFIGVAILITGGNLYAVMKPTTGSSMNVVAIGVDAIDAGASPDVVVAGGAYHADIGAGGGYLFFWHAQPPIGIARTPLVDAGAPAPYFFPLPAKGVAGAVATNSQKYFFGIDNSGVCGIPFDGASVTGDGGLPCGGSTIVAPLDGGGSNVFSLAANESDVFLAYGNHIDSASAAGGVAAPLITQNNYSIANLIDDNGMLFWGASGSGGPGSVWRAPDDGGAPEALTRDAFDGGSSKPVVAADGQGAYWSVITSDKIWAANRDGTNARLVACDPSGGVPALTTDARFVYWIGNDAAVWRAPKR